MTESRDSDGILDENDGSFCVRACERRRCDEKRTRKGKTKKEGGRGERARRRNRVMCRVGATRKKLSSLLPFSYASSIQRQAAPRLQKSPRKTPPRSSLSACDYARSIPSAFARVCVWIRIFAKKRFRKHFAGRGRERKRLEEGGGEIKRKIRY